MIHNITPREEEEEEEEEAEEEAEEEVEEEAEAPAAHSRSVRQSSTKLPYLSPITTPKKELRIERMLSI